MEASAQSSDDVFHAISTLQAPLKALQTTHNGCTALCQLQRIYLAWKSYQARWMHWSPNHVFHAHCQTIAFVASHTWNASTIHTRYSLGRHVNHMQKQTVCLQRLIYLKCIYHAYKGSIGLLFSPHAMLACVAASGVHVVWSERLTECIYFA